MAIDVGFLDSTAVKVFAGVFAGAASALTIHQIILQLKNFHNRKLQVCFWKTQSLALAAVYRSALAEMVRGVQDKNRACGTHLSVIADPGVQDTVYGTNLLAG